MVLGGISCLNNDTTSCDPCEPAAQALFVTFLLNNDNFTNNIALEWEKQVFEQIINNYNDGEYGDFNVSENLGVPKPKSSYITYMAQRSISDELILETQSNMFIVVLSYGLMLFYISIAIGSFPSKVHSGFDSFTNFY